MRLKKTPEHILSSALVLSFVCKCSCSHKTETNGSPKSKDMAMSLALRRQKWRAFLAPVSSFHLLHPVEVKMDGPLALESHIRPLCWHIVSSFCPSLALKRSACQKLFSNQWQPFLNILFLHGSPVFKPPSKKLGKSLLFDCCIDATLSTCFKHFPVVLKLYQVFKLY